MLSYLHQTTPRHIRHSGRTEGSVKVFGDSVKRRSLLDPKTTHPHPPFTCPREKSKDPTRRALPLPVPIERKKRRTVV